MVRGGVDPRRVSVGEFYGEVDEVAVEVVVYDLDFFSGVLAGVRVGGEDLVAHLDLADGLAVAVSQQHRRHGGETVHALARTSDTVHDGQDVESRQRTMPRRPRVVPFSNVIDDGAALDDQVGGGQRHGQDAHDGPGGHRCQDITGAVDVAVECISGELAGGAGCRQTADAARTDGKGLAPDEGHNADAGPDKGSLSRYLCKSI
jgi:hypothetical protein